MVSFIVCHRRDLLRFGVLAPFATLSLPRLGYAQDAKALDAAVQEARQIAESLEASINGASFPMGANQAENWAGEDQRGRMMISEAGAGVPTNEIREFILPDYVTLFDAMISAEVPPIPAPSEIAALDTEQVEVEQCPPKGELIFNIILEGLGFEQEVEALREIITLIGGDQILSEAEDALGEKNIDMMLGKCSELLRMLVTSKTLRLVGEKFGPEIVSRLLKKLSFRFVPFVGWGYVLAALAISVHRHWSEIECNFD